MSNAKIFERYELAKVLFKNGLTNITQWTCMIQKMNDFNTKAYEERDGGVRIYGLFALYHPYWCEIDGKSDGGCKISCDKFLDDDLTDDIECVKHILEVQGIGAWNWQYQLCKDDK